MQTAKPNLIDYGALRIEKDRPRRHNINADLLALVKLFERSVVYQIKKAESEGDDEGARLMAFTLHQVRAAIAKAEGR